MTQRMSEKGTQTPLTREVLGNPGWTPGTADVAGLIVALGEASEDDAPVLEKALLRAHASTPDPVLETLLDAMPGAVRPLRGRLTRVLGRVAVMAPDDGLHDLLCALVEDIDLKTSLNAIAALGALPGDRTERTLVETWETLHKVGMRPEVRRALIRSLGKAGGAGARRILMGYESSLPPLGDREEGRLLTQARLILERTLARQKVSHITADLTILPGSRVVLHMRRGLERFVQDELRSAAEQRGAHAARACDAVLQQDPAKSSGRLFLEERVAVLLGVPSLQAVRCAERWAFVVGGAPAALAREGRIEEALVQTLSEPTIRDWLTRMTAGTVRYRIDAKQATRAQMWGLAERLAHVAPDFVNDPRGSLWEIGVVPDGRHGALIEVRPKGLADERFAYRDQTVPASSHPPLAAALARLANVREGDIVWDPFVGAGTELIERARLGPCDALWGTDIEDGALQRARVNLTKAGLTQAHLEKADARTWSTAQPTLTITNPPLGRRVARGYAKTLLVEVAAHIARQLAPGGRLVWVSPFPEETRQVLEAHGLTMTHRSMVDMGGFDAEMQRAEKGC